MQLAELKTTDLKRDKKYTFVISMGSTEQHGPFLPLGTDSYINDIICMKAGERLRNVMFLPTLNITSSEEHAGFLGTVWVSEYVFGLALRDICNSIRDYAKNIILISWHGGNENLLNSFAHKEISAFKPARLFHIAIHNEEVEKKIQTILNGSVDEHAGNTEISMMLAINGKLVKKPNKKRDRKHPLNMDWENDYVIERSLDGVVDKNSEWIFSKKLGTTCIDIYANFLVKEITRIIRIGQ